MYQTDSIEDGISDKLVLIIISFAFLTSQLVFPISKVLAEINKIEPGQVVVSFEKKDYSVLLSALFGNVGQEVNNEVDKYILNIDEYRIRVAKQIQQNNNFINALEELPEDVKNKYMKEIKRIKEGVRKQKVRIFPFIESDAFLSNAVREKYDLYLSFIDELISKINNNITFKELNNIRSNATSIRSDIAILYLKIKSNI